MIKVREESILPEPSDEIIIKTEKFYRIQFPENYVKFLKGNNGAIPIDNTFEYNSHVYLIERFLCLLANDVRDEMDSVSWSEIRVIITQLDERLVEDEDMLGMNIIPIAVIFAGDYVCLDFRNNPDEPEVCVWYHEQSGEFEPITKKIADNFSEFLSMLKE